MTKILKFLKASIIEKDYNPAYASGWRKSGGGGLFHGLFHSFFPRQIAHFLRWGSFQWKEQICLRIVFFFFFGGVYVNFRLLIYVHPAFSEHKPIGIQPWIVFVHGSYEIVAGFVSSGYDMGNTCPGYTNSVCKLCLGDVLGIQKL